MTETEALDRQAKVAAVRPEFMQMWKHDIEPHFLPTDKQEYRMNIQLICWRVFLRAKGL